MSKAKKFFGILLALILLAGMLMGIYMTECSGAGALARQELASHDGVLVTERTDGALVFAPEQPVAGLIFYPGGRVDYTAYAPLMQECAQRGILCILVKMPFHLAVLDVDAADRYPADYPGITRWYVGGHSLGGAMAAEYASTHTNQLTGLVLLGAYSEQDLSGSGLKVLSVDATEDGIVDEAERERCRANLPEDTREGVIEGGCHSGYGDYGHQKGDGTPEITSGQQMYMAAEQIGLLINPPEK